VMVGRKFDIVGMDVELGMGIFGYVGSRISIDSGWMSLLCSITSCWPDTLHIEGGHELL